MANNLITMDLDGRGELLWLSETEYVRQASSDYVLNGLAQSLALVVPTGMSEDDREQWLAAATIQIYEKHLSANDLDFALRKSRDEADHPSKIIPGIMRALGDDWRPQKGIVSSGSTVTNISERVETILAKLRDGAYNQDEIDELPERLKRLAIEQGSLRMVGGKFVWRAPKSQRIEA